MCLQLLLSSNCTPSLTCELSLSADTDLTFIAIFQPLNHCFTFLGTCEWILHRHKWNVKAGNEWQQIPQRKVIKNRAFVKTHRRNYRAITTWKFLEPGQQTATIYLLPSGSFQQPPTHIYDPAADAEVALWKETTAASVQVLPATFNSSIVEIQKASSNEAKRNEAAVSVSTSSMTIEVRSGLVSFDPKVIKTPFTNQAKYSRRSTSACKGDENLEITGLASKWKRSPSTDPRKLTTIRKLLKLRSDDLHQASSDDCKFSIDLNRYGSNASILKRIADLSRSSAWVFVMSEALYTLNLEFTRGGVDWIRPLNLMDQISTLISPCTADEKKISLFKFRRRSLGDSASLSVKTPHAANGSILGSLSSFSWIEDGYASYAIDDDDYSWDDKVLATRFAEHKEWLGLCEEISIRWPQCRMWRSWSFGELLSSELHDLEN